MQNQQKPTHPLIWIIFVIIVIAAAAVVYFIWQGQNSINTNGSNTNTQLNTNSLNSNSQVNQNQNVNANTNSNTNVVTNTNTSTNTNVDTTGWKTYNNKTYNYSIEYPSAWNFKEFNYTDQRNLSLVGFGAEPIKELGDGKTRVSAEVLSLNLLKGFTPEDLATEFEVLITQSQSKTINGMQAIEYTGNADVPTKSLTILYDSKKNIVLHVGVIGADNFAIFDQMITTLTLSK